MTNATTTWMSRIAAAALVATMGAGAVGVQAQPRPPQDAQRHDDRGRAQPDRRHDAHRPDARNHRGAGPDHRWVKGSRVPPQYRAHGYVVNDWRGHRLSSPPRGYHWIQNGGDYLLVAIASGVVAQIVFGN
nr:RcnB family protein [Comamonas koreensis]